MIISQRKKIGTTDIEIENDIEYAQLINICEHYLLGKKINKSQLNYYMVALESLQRTIELCYDPKQD